MSSPVVYIHSNEQQMLGAIASARLSRNSVVPLERLTQPQNAGLSIDVNIGLQGPTGRLRRWLRKHGVLSARRFPAHSEVRQKAFVFSLVKECLASCEVGEDVLRHALAVRDVRPGVSERIVTCGNCKPVAP